MIFAPSSIGHTQEGLAVILDVVYNHFGNVDNYLYEFADNFKSSVPSNGMGRRDQFRRRELPGGARIFCSRMPVTGSTNSISTVFATMRRNRSSTIPAAHSGRLQSSGPRCRGGRRSADFFGGGKRAGGCALHSAGGTGRVRNGCDLERRLSSFGPRADDRLESGVLLRFSRHGAGIGRGDQAGLHLSGAAFGLARKAARHADARIAGIGFCQFHPKSRSGGEFGHRAANSRINQPRAISGHDRAVAACRRKRRCFFRVRNSRPPVRFCSFADFTGDMAKAIAKGRGEFMSQFPHLETEEAQRILANPCDPNIFERCKLDFAERTKHKPIYDLHIDLLKLRHEEPVFSRQSSDQLETATLNADCLVVRYFDDSQQDRLVVANFRSRFALRSGCRTAVGAAGRLRLGDDVEQQLTTLWRRRHGAGGNQERVVHLRRGDDRHGRRTGQRIDDGRQSDSRIPPTRKLEMTAQILHRMPWSAWPDKNPEVLLDREWLVTNGLGGYASGTVSGACTRRYHGLLIAALPAPFGRYVMFNHLAEEIKLEDRKTLRLDNEDVSGDGVETAIRLAGRVSRRNGVAGVGIRNRPGAGGKANFASLLAKHGACDLSAWLSAPGSVRLRLRPSMHFRSHEAPVNDPLRHPYELTARHERIEIRDEPRAATADVFESRRTAAWCSMAAFGRFLIALERSRGYEYEGSLWSPGYFRADLQRRRRGGADRFDRRVGHRFWRSIPKRRLQSELQRQERLILQARSGGAGRLRGGACVGGRSVHHSAHVSRWPMSPWRTPPATTCER